MRFDKSVLELLCGAHILPHLCGQMLCYQVSKGARRVRETALCNELHIPQPYSASESNDIESTLAIVWGYLK